MDNLSLLRSHIVDQLTGKNAHVGLEKAVDGVEFDEAGIIPAGCVHSIWMLVEHIRIAQHDILDFSRNPEYESLSWPDEYWPANESPKNQLEWEKSVAAIEKDRDEMIALVKDPDNDLLEPLAHGDGQTLFREAMLIVDHSSYHTGQIIQLRRMMGSW